MSKRSRKKNKGRSSGSPSVVDLGNYSDPQFQTAWVLSVKKVGDPVAGWVVDRLYRDQIRKLDGSERCSVTSFCYPPGAKLVKARLVRDSGSICDGQPSLAG